MELVLILVLLAVCAAISAPSLAGFARARQLPNTAAVLVSTANWCRLQALNKGIEYRLNFDMQTNSWFVTRDHGDGTFVQVVNNDDGEDAADLGKLYTMPEGVTFANPPEFTPTPTDRSDLSYLSFLPGGKTDVVAITLKRENATTVVKCEMPMATFHVMSSNSK